MNFKLKGSCLIIIMVLLFSNYYLFYTDTFILESINIYDNKILNDDEIKEHLELNMKMNIFTYDKNYIEDNLKGHPIIKDSIIYVDNKNELGIKVLEREELVIIFSQNTYHYIDDEGFLLYDNTNYKENELIIVEGIDIYDSDIGLKLKSENENELNFIIEFIKAYNILESPPNLDGIFVEDNYITFNVEGNTYKISSRTDHINSIILLEELISYANEEGIEESIFIIKYDGYVIKKYDNIEKYDIIN